MNTWWEREGKHVYRLVVAKSVKRFLIPAWAVRSVLGELYRHHKGWRVVPWHTEGKGVNLPAMPLKEAKRLAKLLLPEE